MHLSLKVAIVFSAFCSFNIYAATTLSIPSNLKLLAVNMEKPDLEGGLFSDEKTVELPDGENQIVFKYQPEFEIHDDIKTVYGDVIIAKFDVKSEKLRFELPEFKTYRQAETYISPLEWQLFDSKGQPVDLVEDVLESDGIQIGRNYAQEARNYNIAGGVAGVAVTVNQHSQAITGVEPKAVAVVDTKSATAQDSQMVDLLKTMYQKATPQEKETFKKWVAQQ